jgi:hypothetical protein
MDFKGFIKSISILEKVLLVLFIAYLALGTQTPSWLIPYINSSVGLVVILVVVFYLLFYTHPALGVLSLFVAYEMLRRSSVLPMAKASIEERTPSQKKKDTQLQKMNTPSTAISLEESIVQKMAPVGYSEPSQIVDSEFQPVASALTGGSLF